MVSKHDYIINVLSSPSHEKALTAQRVSGEASEPFPCQTLIRFATLSLGRLRELIGLLFILKPGEA